MSSELVFPSYLLSHALSTSHYSFLKRAEAASSSHELTTLCQTETDRLRALINKGKLSDAATKEALVLLMAIGRASTSDGHLALGLVPALNIATGSKDNRTKSIGYLYLNENLTTSNDIYLLLFNTILKDLESSHAPSIVLALRSIVSIPSAEIAPAVESQLVHLVSHKSPNIRRLALAALLALSSVAGSDVLSGLKERKIWKRVEDADPAVSLHAVRTLAKMEAVGLVETSSASSAILRALGRIVDRPAAEAAHLPLRSLLAAILAAAEGLAARLDLSQRQEVTSTLVAFLARLANDPSSDVVILPLYSAIVTTYARDSASCPSLSLLPIRRALLSSQPNGQLWALRCLAILPVSVWAGDNEDNALGQDSMQVLMDGLDSRDPAIRTQTLEILRQLSPELPELQLDRIVDLLASSPASSSVREREASVGRALEIIELLCSSSDEEHASAAANKVWQTLQATHRAHVPSTVDEVVLEESVGRLLGWVGLRPSSWQTTFAIALLDLATASAVVPSPTSAVVVAAVACEHATTLFDPADTCSLLTRLLEGASSVSIQEALLFSLAAVCVQLETGRPDNSVLDAVGRLKETPGKHLRHRCEAFLLIASSPGAFLPLKSLLLDATLPSVVQAFETHARSLAPPRTTRPDKTSSADASSSARPKDLSASTLRYDAYPAAARSDPPTKMDKNERRERRQREKDQRRREDGARIVHIGEENEVAVTAGELALMGLEEGELDVETPTTPAGEDDTDPFKVSPKKPTKPLAPELITLDGGSPFLESHPGRRP